MPDSESHEAEVEQLYAAMLEGRSVREVAKQLGISEASLRRWAIETEDRASRYARAREVQADAHVDRALSVAEGAKPETWQADKLLVDTLKWRAAKFHPNRYGDKTALEHSGKAGGPIQVVVQYEDGSDAT